MPRSWTRGARRLRLGASCSVLRCPLGCGGAQIHAPGGADTRFLLLFFFPCKHPRSPGEPRAGGERQWPTTGDGKEAPRTPGCRWGSRSPASVPVHQHSPQTLSFGSSCSLLGGLLLGTGPSHPDARPGHLGGDEL